MKEKYQQVIIKLVSGAKGTFTGPVIAESEGDEIESIKFTRPADLPDGCSFGEIPTSEGESSDD